MAKKMIIALQGSYRKNGKTATMMDYAVKAAKEKGHEVTVVNLHEMNIDYCKGCMKCDEQGECILKNDDMHVVCEYMQKADVIILAAPVYWGNVPAIVKNVFDRMRGASMAETNTFPKPKLSGKRYMLLTSCNTPMPFARWCGQSSGIDRSVREYFKTSGVKKIGTVVCDNSAKIDCVPDKIFRRIDYLVKEI